MDESDDVDAVRLPSAAHHEADHLAGRDAQPIRVANEIHLPIFVTIAAAKNPNPPTRPSPGVFLLVDRSGGRSAEQQPQDEHGPRQDDTASSAQPQADSGCSLSTVRRRLHRCGETDKRQRTRANLTMHDSSQATMMTRMSTLSVTGGIWTLPGTSHGKRC